METKYKVEFIMSKIVDYKVEILNYDDIRSVIEDAVILLDKETAINFRDWCDDKQQPFLRNSYQGMQTSELWDEFSRNK